ncbi:phage head-tail connector protein [Faecalicatena contorta]|uniref:phage head-tail connector protein n=1 Tax=Faecalicatena contorta TaxID=39482 RepID=UPI003217B43E
MEKKLINEIITDLTDELSKDKDFDEDALSSKVKNAVREIRRDRNYPVSYGEEQIMNDLNNYYSNIRELALYDYNQIGAEGQLAHSENGTSRTWENRIACKNGVVAFCR